MAISKQKLNELKSWFSEHFNRSQPCNSSPFLLLNGPAGSGKTTSIRVLSKEYDVQLVELPSTFIFTEQDIVTDSFSNLEIKVVNKEFDHIKSIGSESQLNRFSRFLCDLNNYKKLIFDYSSYKLLLIEDIPQIFHIKPEFLHEELIKLHQKFKSRTIPLVFIISDSVNCSSIENKILPKTIQTKLNFTVISFKPISNATLTKTLSKTILNGQKLEKSDIDKIVRASSNDIRNAYNYFLFKHSNSSEASSFSSKSAIFCKKAKLMLTKKKSNVSDNNNIEKLFSGREEQLTLVHAIGKILYAKRLPNQDLDVLDFIRSHPQFDRSLLRNPLVEQQPEKIPEKTNANCNTLIDWLYENYYDFINEENSDSLNHSLDCLEIFSMNDSYFNDFESKNILENISTSFLIRGIMYSLNRDSSSYEEEINSKSIGNKSKSNNLANKFTFRPLRGPNLKQIYLKTSHNNQPKDNEIFSNSIESIINEFYS